MSELRSNITEVRQFMHSNVWRDMHSEMEAWLNDIRDQLEQAQELDILRRLQGNAEAVNRFLQLPESLIEIFEIDANATEFRKRLAE